MQITVKSTKILKTGTSDKGNWELLLVTSVKGTEYTTFDKKVKHLAEGSVIEIGEPEEQKGKLSFKEAEIIKEAPITLALEPQPSEKSYKRDTEGIDFEYQWKARLQEIELKSKEAETVFSGIIELAAAKVIPLDNPYLITALEWAEVRLREEIVTAIVSPRPAPPALEPKPSGVKAEEEDKPFPHIGALLQWCAKQGITRTKFMEILHVGEKDLPKVNIEEAHQSMEDYLKEHPRII